MDFIKKHKNIFGALALVAAAAAIIAAAYIKNSSEPAFTEYTAFINAVENGEVETVNLTDESFITFTYTGGETAYRTDNPRKEFFKEELLLSGVAVTENNTHSDVLLQVGFIAAVAIGMFILMRKRNGQGKFAASAEIADAEGVYVNSATRCGFGDVAGNDEAKESVADVVDFLREPGKYARYGARMPRGILLHGQPGTGKTLMARAMAGEAGVPFFAVSGSDFVQMYVGVGAARVRELFKKAKNAGRAVIFIDEIDALGKKRGDGATGGNDEREQTLNALLTEMSGFTDGEGIVVVAATNRPETLDDALLRPGRFDRKIEIALPDINARKQILELHAKNKPLSGDTDLTKLARDTVFFSGAMLEGLLNDAAINAARRSAVDIVQDDISKAYYTALAGYEKKDRSAIRAQELQVTAWHESGHALAAALVSPENRVARVSIIPSSAGVGGFCVNIPPERMYVTKREIERQIIVHLAGRCAEELRFGAENVTTGAANDIEKATDTAIQYITRFGMSASAGLINRQSRRNEADILKECGELIARLYGEAKELLKNNYHLLEALAEKLLTNETLDGDEVEEICLINNRRRGIL